MECQIADIIKVVDYYPLGTTISHFLIIGPAVYQSFSMNTLLYKVLCLETGIISTCSFEDIEYVTYEKVA